ncbi:unnamed protein product [Hapterophycus canaliculatus]
MRGGFSTLPSLAFFIGVVSYKNIISTTPYSPRLVCSCVLRVTLSVWSFIIFPFLWVVTRRRTLSSYVWGTNGRARLWGNYPRGLTGPTNLPGFLITARPPEERTCEKRWRLADLGSCRA